MEWPKSFGCCLASDPMKNSKQSIIIVPAGSASPYGCNDETRTMICLPVDNDWSQVKSRYVVVFLGKAQLPSCHLMASVGGPPSRYLV
mmetsp:Transcript_12513/g.29020  ORF Transcript_12513/g.29020 Transcript_12513/m.29020 type:complete len:88 (-) Transcript_12513:417-680(-)